MAVKAAGMNTNICPDPESFLRKASFTFKECKKARFLFLFLLPAVLWYLVFYYGPIYGLVIAFKDYSIGSGVQGSPWVGFKHFEKMFASEEFLRVLRNTLVISGLKMIFVYTSGLALALMLNEVLHTKFKNIVQDIATIPRFLSWVIIGAILTEILSPSSGLVNQVIMILGGKPVYFLADTKWFVPIVIISDMWESAGWNSIIYTAAITSIEQDMYEAAIIDGAGRFKQLVHITLPSIMNVVIIMMIMNIGQILNAGFDQIFNLYNPKVYDVADIIDTYVYRQGLIQFNYSYSAAVGLFKNVVGLLLVYLCNLGAQKYEQVGLW